MKALPRIEIGHGAALWMLHGYGGSGASLSDLARRLSDTRRCVLPDLPGHGDAAARILAGDYDFLQCVDEVAHSIAAHEQAPVDLFGYSMGARIALALALRHPALVRRLCLLGARAGIADPAARAARCQADRQWIELLQREGIEAFAAAWLAQPLFATLSAAQRAHEQHARRRQDPAALARAMAVLGLAAQPPLQDQLATLEPPTLLLCGRLDIGFHAATESLAQAIPDARTLWIAAAGHAAHLESPETVAQGLVDFLQDHPRPVSAPSLFSLERAP